MSGNRRNPFVAKKTKGWELVPDTGKAKQLYTVVGYYPTRKKPKILLSLMYKYALIHEIVPKERNLVEYLDIRKAGNPNAYNREPFSKAAVKRIWEAKNSNIYYSVILMLVYTGCRISELLNLKNENVHLYDRCFDIIASKTAARILQDLIRKGQCGMFDTMQITEKNRKMISGITGNMHDGYDIIFKSGHSCHCS